jgi:predicted negative regulator of RcsB-dependent stress response
LDPDRIALDTRLVKSKATILQAKEIVDKYEKQVNALLDNMRNDINRLNLSANEKAEARKAFETGTQESSETRSQIWQLERAIAWKCGAMIDYLYWDYGNWSVSDGQIIFSNNEKAAAYNRYLEAIEKLVSQQEQLRRYGAH